MFIKLEGATPTTDKTADIAAVVDALNANSLQVNLELCHVNDAEAYLYNALGAVPTDQAVADHLAGWTPWSAMSGAVRLSTVTTRRATLSSLRV